MYLEEFDKYAEIACFNNVRIQNVEQFLKTFDEAKSQDVHVQFFEPNLVATWQHLYFAVVNALIAFKNKVNISKDLGMEILLYASTQHQIRKATEILGIRSSSSSIAVLVLGATSEIVESQLYKIGRQIGGERKDSILELSHGKMELIQSNFGISNAEIETVMEENGVEEALINLVIERMALLTTRR